MKKLVIAGAIIGLPLLGMAACTAVVGGAAAHSVKTQAPQTNAAGVSRGVASKDATADIVLDKSWSDDGYNQVSGRMTITNHSTKRSNYSIDFAMVSPNGSIQYGTSTEYAENVEPAQHLQKSITMWCDAKVPTTAIIKIVGVERIASA